MLDSFHVSVPGQTLSEHSNTDVVDREIEAMPAGIGWEDIEILLKAKGLSIGRAELRRMVLDRKPTPKATFVRHKPSGTADLIRTMPEMRPEKVAQIVGCTPKYVSVIRWRDANREHFNESRNAWRKAKITTAAPSTKGQV